ncbi:MAG TPA: aldehyde dehydrogenase family protein [Cyclobacteriaceae bacterium]|nr:aldehyde dehydrogenase family protein [Cyclobacteriaceae bacterium]
MISVDHNIKENSQIEPELDRMHHVFQLQRTKSLEKRTASVSGRKQSLKKLKNWILVHKQDIIEAVYSDYRKPAVEVIAHEILPVLAEIKHTLSHLDQWTRPKKVDAPITYLGTRSYVQFEPKGVTLIIAPWNFPFNIAIVPLVSALAAGNTVFIKPSEQTPHTAALISKMIAAIFEQDEVVVFEGDASVSQNLLKLPFDHIYFTGSPAIGKLVMKAAAEHLSSVTLELGGKSPAIIDDTVNIKSTAKRIAWAKFVNNGQICVAPDYAYVHKNIFYEFVEALKQATEKLFKGNSQGGFDESGSYGRIVNERHLKRLLALLNDAKVKGAKVLIGGNFDLDSNFVEPTLITDVNENMELLQEEIFGPILPIIIYEDIERVLAEINNKPKPLALYVFSNRKSKQQYILKNTSSGTACINDCVLQYAHSNLPFGGVNNSGIGKSHGYYGFIAFSNEKAVLKQKSGITALSFFYPPYTKLTNKIVNLVLKLY